MHVIQDRHFHSETVQLDETLFRRCTFTNCILNYSGGSVSFQDVNTSGCRYMFFAKARTTVEFLSMVGLLAGNPSDWAELDPDVH